MEIKRAGVRKVQLFGCCNSRASLERYLASEGWIALMARCAHCAKEWAMYIEPEKISHLMINSTERVPIDNQLCAQCGSRSVLVKAMA